MSLNAATREREGWLPVRLGRWRRNFEIAGNHEQTNSGGDCSEWVNGKLWEVSPCVHQGETDIYAYKQRRYRDIRTETQRRLQ